MIRRCTHGSRRICAWCFMQSLAFPIEHVLWERAPILSAITRALGV